MNTVEKSFEFASESSKLLITLSTGIIAFSIAFFDKDSTMRPLLFSEKIILFVSWFAFLASAVIGIWVQLALTDVLEPPSKPQVFNPTIRDTKIKIPFRYQALTFGSGVVMIFVYGCVKMF